jgi:nitroreductase
VVSVHREPLEPWAVPAEEGHARLAAFAADLARRRSVRAFDPDRGVPIDLVRDAVAVAARAPSGANVQPWRFVVVTDPTLKGRIRDAAEAEERAFYEGDHAAWHAALAPLETTWTKPHLTDAPVLVVVFEVHASESEPKPYYVKESVGIAVGFLLAALHVAGLAALTHTPSPMRFLTELLGRPRNERPFVVIPVGYPAADATVPALTRKALDEVLVILAG